jgi:hypothetical protein
MDCPAFRGASARSSAGFTLVEALLALMLLGACLVPASYALRDAVRAPADNASAARKLDCVTSLMETQLATPYDVLYGKVNPNSSTPVKADANCPAMQVTIMSYGVDSTRKLGPGGTSAFLLSVSVSVSVSGSVAPDDLTPGNPYTLTTLVAR